MGIKMHGVNRLLKELDQKFSKNRIDSITDEALTKGALIFGMELRRQLKTFSDGTGYSEGYTLDELTISPPGTGSNKARSIQVYWRGPRERYRIIHLNEWGTIRNPKPRGKGKIAKAMKLSKKEYGKAIREELRRAI